MGYLFIIHWQLEPQLDFAVAMQDELLKRGHDWLFPPLRIFKALSGTDYVFKKIPSSSMSSIAS
jgi:hypothetical protein